MRIINRIGFALIFLSLGLNSVAQGSRDPEVTEVYVDVSIVDPYSGDSNVPSDAIVLFDGTGLDEWQTPHISLPESMEDWKPLISTITDSHKGDPAPWSIINGELQVIPGEGDIATKHSFGNVQLHVEWLAPVDEGKTGQAYSNSGIFLMGLYEVQVLNSYENQTYSNGQASAIYKQREPMVNASVPPGQWQTYDIIFTAPVFGENGRLVSPARITVLHNGVLVQNNVSLHGPTVYIGSSHYIPHPQKLPLRLQDHGDKIRFRNIWIREL